MASIERTAYPRFKRAVLVRELHEAFTPTAGEIAWEREQTRTPEHLLALVVLLKSCRRMGYFPVLAEVLPPVTEHLLIYGRNGRSNSPRQPCSQQEGLGRIQRRPIRHQPGLRDDLGKAPG